MNRLKIRTQKYGINYEVQRVNRELNKGNLLPGMAQKSITKGTISRGIKHDSEGGSQALFGGLDEDFAVVIGLYDTSGQRQAQPPSAFFCRKPGLKYCFKF